MESNGEKRKCFFKDFITEETNRIFTILEDVEDSEDLSVKIVQKCRKKNPTKLPDPSTGRFDPH